MAKTIDNTKRNSDCIRVYGARTNNLKNIDVEIPRNQLVCITGLSGSGKSSLAFDTVFAEGQRQYIESLSLYSRQFFEQKGCADVDLIEGLEPTLSLDQHSSAHSHRSTVGTVTETYDFLRLLMARSGDVRCSECGGPIVQQTPKEIANIILRLPADTKAMVMAPMVAGRKGRHEDILNQIRSERLVRVRVDGETLDIESVPPLDQRKSHSIDAITDRIIIREGIEPRLLEAVDLAVRLASGRVTVAWQPREKNADGSSKSWEEKLFSTRFACPDCDVSYREVQPRSFSFNSPYGACPDCDGLGYSNQFDPLRVLDLSRSINDGAVVAWQGLSGKALSRQHNALEPVLEKLQIEPSRPLDYLGGEKREQFLDNPDPKAPGLLQVLEKELATTASDRRIDTLEELRDDINCKQCRGTRLSSQANSVLIGGQTISRICAMPIESAVTFFNELRFEGIKEKIAEPILKELRHRLTFLDRVGVGYLTLDRRATTLSGGEFQRVRLAASIGSGLTSVCYVLDEPSIGLHQRDNERLIESIRGLQRAGNSIIVVEHDEAMMRAADHLIDVGPGAGKQGGQIVAVGTPDEVAACKESLTGDYLAGRSEILVPRVRRPPKTDQKGGGQWLKLNGASGFNLNNVSVEIPLGTLTVVSGVSGSGKSTLINRTLIPAIAHKLELVAHRPEPFDSIEGVEKIDKLIAIDQKPVGRTPRGCAITYTGVFAEIRKVFAATKRAREKGFTHSRFSFNSARGWCPDCKGHGLKRLKMNFLADMYVTCETCSGRRFNLETLQIRYNNLSIADVLELRVAEALDVFENFSRIHGVLTSLNDVGLGYLPLGQPSTTLSGGEAQRIKLATELARTQTGDTLYLLDEPTTGLHHEDIRRLMGILMRLVDAGNTVIVIEHNLDVIKCADWVIDLGPEGGRHGGDVIATGTPEDVAKIDGSFTGVFLREMLGQSR